MWHQQVNQSLRSPPLVCASLGSKILLGESFPIAPENAERRNEKTISKNFSLKFIQSINHVVRTQPVSCVPSTIDELCQQTQQNLCRLDEEDADPKSVKYLQ